MEKASHSIWFEVNKITFYRLLSFRRTRLFSDSFMCCFSRCCMFFFFYSFLTASSLVRLQNITEPTSAVFFLPEAVFLCVCCTNLLGQGHQFILWGLSWGNAGFDLRIPPVLNFPLDVSKLVELLTAFKSMDLIQINRILQFECIFFCICHPCFLVFQNNTLIVSFLFILYCLHFLRKYPAVLLKSFPNSFYSNLIFSAYLRWEMS